MSDNKKTLDWQDTRNIKLDETILFGIGYDFYGLDNLRQEAAGPNGNYLAWPSGGMWSLYRDSDGMLAFEAYLVRDECEQAAEVWCVEERPE